MPFTAGCFFFSILGALSLRMALGASALAPSLPEEQPRFLYGHSPGHGPLAPASEPVYCHRPTLSQVLPAPPPSQTHTHTHSLLSPHPGSLAEKLSYFMCHRSSQLGLSLIGWALAAGNATSHTAWSCLSHDHLRPEPRRLCDRHRPPTGSLSSSPWPSPTLSLLLSPPSPGGGHGEDMPIPAESSSCPQPQREGAPESPVLASL